MLKFEYYEFLDSGEGRKLERFNNYIIDRPERRAIETKSLNENEWSKADAVFKEGIKGRIDGEWLFKNNIVLTPWICNYDNIKFKLELTQAGQLGCFPDKQEHWNIIQNYVMNKPKARVLNLFGYTAIASLIAASHSALVTHVDSSKKAIKWARDNQILSSLSGANIRWMVDDVQKFVNREINRGSQYDLIILDPPTFGRGTNNELWHIDKDLAKLLSNCHQILNKQDSLLMLTTYSPDLSYLELEKICKMIFYQENCNIRTGQLILQSKDNTILPQSEFCLVKYE